MMSASYGRGAVTSEHRRLRVLASGATELWAPDVRQGDRGPALGDAALEIERPLHAAREGADHTVCGQPTWHMHEYPISFADQELRLRCPACDRLLGHPLS